MFNPSEILTRLSDADVDYILIGGVAALAHGCARLTQDVDVLYARTEDNFDRIVKAFAECSPYPRGAPVGLPFQWCAETFKFGLNFTLTTTLGDVDLLGQIPGGDYISLKPHSISIEMFERTILCLALDKLIEVKRCAGRPKDFEAIAELERIRRNA